MMKCSIAKARPGDLVMTKRHAAALPGADPHIGYNILLRLKLLFQIF